jgi:hypothetical protein
MATITTVSSSGLFFVDTASTDPAAREPATLLHRLFRAGAAPGNDAPLRAWEEARLGWAPPSGLGAFVGPGGGDWLAAAARPDRRLLVDCGAGAVHAAPDTFEWEVALARRAAPEPAEPDAAEPARGPGPNGPNPGPTVELRVLGVEAGGEGYEVRTYVAGPAVPGGTGSSFRRVPPGQLPADEQDGGTAAHHARFWAEFESDAWDVIF